MSEGLHQYTAKGGSGSKNPELNMKPVYLVLLFLLLVGIVGICSEIITPDAQETMEVDALFEKYKPHAEEYAKSTFPPKCEITSTGRRDWRRKLGDEGEMEYTAVFVVNAKCDDFITPYIYRLVACRERNRIVQCESTAY
jgi:hypothetical protein